MSVASVGNLLSPVPHFVLIREFTRKALFVLGIWEIPEKKKFTSLYKVEFTLEKGLRCARQCAIFVLRVATLE